MSHQFCWKGYVYVAWNEEQATLGMTPWPMLDLAYLHREKGYEQLLCLTPELPLGKAFYVGSKLARQDFCQPLTFKLGETGGTGGGSIPVVDQLKLFVNKKLKTKMKLLIDYFQAKAAWHLKAAGIRPEWHQIMAGEVEDMELPVKEDRELVGNLLTGRLLFPGEILQAARENFLDGWSPFQLKILLQFIYLQRSCHLYPGIVWLGKDTYRCVRCGTVDKLVIVNCLDCGGECLCCEECQSMGESRLCRPLYGLPGKTDQEQFTGVLGFAPDLAFSLTQSQQAAADQVLDFVVREDKSAKKEALVWAVCGAGKTEVSFSAILWVLNQGGRVLFAIPRRDVVLELIPRLEQAFPGVEISAIYGGSRGKYTPARLVLATTHQAVRFYRQFDLVVLDEVDAYPYQGSRMLHYFVHRARKEEGKIVYMSATPGREMYREAKQGKIRLVHIPARHHGYPVPEPEFLIGSHCKVQENGKIIFGKEILTFIHRTIEGDLAQLFIFTPSVFLAEQVGKSLAQRMQLPPFNDFGGDWVRYSHARDPHRDEKRNGFLAGEFPVLVSTTIMERGITVARANVLVLFANYQQVFDAGALVQMAGRSGRSSMYPHGKVLFAAEKASPAMAEAVAMIKEQNQEAGHRGYLRDLSGLTGTRQDRC